MSAENKIDWTKPIEVERYNRVLKARVLATDVKHYAGKTILVAYYMPEDKTEYFNRFSNDGRSIMGGINVRNVPEPHYVWLNVYNKDNGSHQVYLYFSEPKHLQNDPRYIFTLKVNIDTGGTEKVYL